jgi:hypothetical protein
MFLVYRLFQWAVTQYMLIKPIYGIVSLLFEILTSKENEI